MFPVSLLSQSTVCEGSVWVAVCSSTLLLLAATYSAGSAFWFTQSFEQWTASPTAHCNKHLLQIFAPQIIMLASHSYGKTLKVSLGSWPLREAPCDIQCRTAFLTPGSGLFSSSCKELRWESRRGSSLLIWVFCLQNMSLVTQLHQQTPLASRDFYRVHLHLSSCSAIGQRPDDMLGEFISKEKRAIFKILSIMSL